MPKYNDNTCNLNRNENLKNPEKHINENVRSTRDK